MSRSKLPLGAAGILIGAMLILSGCATTIPSGEASPSEEPDPLAGTGWVLDSMGGAPVQEGTSVTLQVSDERTLAGSAGCNRYNGAFTSNGDAFTVEPLASTMMACEQPVMEQETLFLAMLEEATQFAIEDDHLTLSDGSGEAMLVFSAQSQDLEGALWVVTGYNNGAEAVVSVAIDTVAELSFGEDGTISGTGGCNRFTGGFTAEGGSLEISALGMTQMACPTPDGVMEQESALLAALESTSRYELEGDVLRLTTDDDTTTVTLTRG